MLLLGTNVLSALTGSAPVPEVAAWMAAGPNT